MRTKDETLTPLDDGRAAGREEYEAIRRVVHAELRDANSRQAVVFRRMANAPDVRPILAHSADSSGP